MSKPNIILFIADDMRFDSSGFGGNDLMKTPNLDKLASHGVVFDNNFVTTSICCVSRASIMSGEYALRHGVYDFDDDMNPFSLENSFPVRLRNAGYHTGFVGKWGFGKGPKELFDQWYGYDGQGDYYAPGSTEHLTDVQTEQALDFLKCRPDDKPFLLIISYKAPHGPFMPQEKFSALYEQITIPRAKSDTPEAASQVLPLLQQSLGYVNYKLKIGADEIAYQDRMGKYYGLIAGLDESVGKILSFCDDKNLRSKSTILFTSDNGLLHGEHGLIGKWCMYEESIRVPLIISPAKDLFASIPPTRIKAISLNIDIAPTILSMANVPVPSNVEGNSLLPLLQDSTPGWREGFYYEHPTMDAVNIVGCDGYRSEEWKYTRYFKGSDYNECLFNLANDPMEFANLAGQTEFESVLSYLRNLTAKEKTKFKGPLDNMLEKYSQGASPAP